jgi:hypothetical protein
MSRVPRPGPSIDLRREQTMMERVESASFSCCW